VSAGSKRTYQIKDFSALTGISVRALHHYDRLGLLKPRRTASGYRAYGETDLGILEQIVALKFIGVPLREIKHLLRTGRDDLASVLAMQRIVLEEKRRRLDLAITAIREAQMTDKAQANPEALKRIIEVIKMQDDRVEFKKQYDALLAGKVERLRAMSPEAREQLRDQFAVLARDVQGALDEDPASPRAQELARRWLELLQAFAPQGEIDPQLLKMAATYLSDGGWPADAPQPEPPFARAVWEFMAKAIAVRQRSSL
jgi:MerR family transcriptional regulator, thiopeptide resistance regulator